MAGAELADPRVLDASVAVRWLVNERGAEDARLLLTEGRRWLAPRLVLVEVAGALRRKCVEQLLTAALAEQCLLLFLDLVEDGVVTLARDETLVVPAMRLALRSGHKLPDCLYLALAERESALLVTADHQLERLARACGIGTVLLPAG